MFDRIITSTNEDDTYLGFWELQILAHKKFFPEKKLTIAFLTERNENDSLITEMKSKGIDVKLYPPIDGIHKGNHAKILRYICASELESEVCVITDIDTIPLQKKYLTNITSRREVGKILCVGAEVYDNENAGKFPAHHITGEGFLFKKLFNPKNLPYDENLNSLKGSKVFDSKECISSSIDNFSDESLIRALLSLNSVPTQHIKRDIDIKREWIDRSWWSISENRLNNGEYIEANLLRPYDKYKKEIKPILDYITK